MSDLPLWAWVEIGLVLFIAGQYFYLRSKESGKSNPGVNESGTRVNE
jgi:hypothetical protein